jgi:hypothetical protein
LQNEQNEQGRQTSQKKNPKTRFCSGRWLLVAGSHLAHVVMDKTNKGKDPASPRPCDVPMATQVKDIGKARKKTASPALNQKWYVVSAKWYESLNKYHSAAAESSVPSPGPITNAELISERSPKDSPQLKPGLQIEADYVVVNEYEWDLLNKWYGCTGFSARANLTGHKKKKKVQFFCTALVACLIYKITTFIIVFAVCIGIISRCRAPRGIPCLQSLTFCNFDRERLTASSIV